MNIKEIAKLAGVSISTVSKIVNQKDESISNETRERVLKIVKEYNYTPYASVTTTNHKTCLLGILLRSTSSFNSSLNGFIETAQSNGYNIIVCNSFLSKKLELKSITSLCKNKVDGVIWEPIDEESLLNSSQFENINIPFIKINSTCDKSYTIPYEKYGYKITEELINLKHKDIACLINENHNTSAFLSGYKKCLFDNNITFDEDLIFHQLNDSLLSKINNRNISAVISSDYIKAIEFYELMNSLNYRIPEDISLISLKDDFVETLSLPKISTFTVLNNDFNSYLSNKIINEIEKRSTAADTFSQEFFLDNDSTVTLPFKLKSTKITVVGSINMDTYLNVANLPYSGKTVSTSTSSIYPGGKGVNQSIGVAKLGHRVTLIGNVGFDLDSNYIYNTLNEYEVDTSGIKRCNDIDTGKAYVFVESSGDSMISILSGANDIFTPEDIEEKKHLFENTGYCLIQSEIPIETVYKACVVANEYNAKIILKPSTCSNIPAEILSSIDIIVPNRNELNELCPNYTYIEDQTDYLLSCGVKTIIVTLGDQGCYVKTAEWNEYFPAANFPSVDNTGASDAFISALASYLLYGYSLRDSVRIAIYAAGFSISREGVITSLIDKNSLETYIRQNESNLVLP